ncbi:WecB/TagA/CpsF family glycosyltransferase [Zunongwangia sp. HRR-M8]|uniref:WecB/TagA/CpsF family glycosyltransferase n=1 Tax=Zunongwangia sp. HRR-M8 TaxID=3015170 RepID=UPI0022DD6A69|nr:WecB/TagA/CpsF family glycosyltransferase [Zunongwangia sp. HRR-M8]WBL22039.1 WecB/TagA/CpsF family glycosyltransferase [Zunongwangia sp. HRR-M8]
MRKRLISIDISIKSYQDFIKDLTRYAEKKISSYTCVANVHMLVEAYKNKDFAAVVNNADMVTPDGMPLAKALNYLYHIKQDRVAGMDLLPDLLELAEEKNINVLFYGGTQLMLDETSKFCKNKYPDLNLVGLISPPFRDLNLEEEEDYIQLINQSEAGFVFVALGCPKQEKWMASMRGRINACMIGIGGALPVMVGMQKRAPKLMQRFSLEWLFRLSQEPRRLFKRYAYTNSLFIYLIVKEKFKR